MSFRAFLLRFARRPIGLRRKARGSKHPGRKFEVEPLESRDVPSASHLDLGTRTSPVAAGYVGVPLVAFSHSLGYGWQSLAGMSAYNSAGRNALTRDGHQGVIGVFDLNVQNGAYQVTALVGSPFAPRDTLSVAAEGRLKAVNVHTAAGQYRAVSFLANVTDGQLNVRFDGRGGANPFFSLAGLNVVPAAAATLSPKKVSANAGPDRAGSEGAAMTFQGSASGIAPLTYRWSFGDGATASGTLTPSHTYADNGKYTVTLTVTDALRRTATDTAVVTVANVAPNATLGNNGPVNEASPVTVSFANPSDPSSADTAAGFRYSFDFNNDGTFDVVDAASPSASTTFDDNGNYVVRGRVKDKDGGFTDYTTTVQVNNVAPTANAHGPYSGLTGSGVAFRGSATDPSSADASAGLTYLWNFGDGTTSTAQNPSKSYSAPGTYTVTLTAIDKDGGSQTATTKATIVTPTDPGDFIKTPFYNIPNFGAHPTVFSVQSGPWSDPNTWSTGQLPGTDDVVAIKAGTTVTYDLSSSPALDTVEVTAGGVLTFRTDVNTSLLVTNLMVLEGGELRIGSADNPVAPDVKAQVVLRNTAIDTTRDPEQFGHSLIGLGKVTIYGAAKPSEVRLAAEPHAGDSTLALSQPATGWAVGDRLVLPDSHEWANSTTQTNYASQYEEATIGAISADGLTVTLTAPLQFDHPGGYDGAGVLDFLPHVADKTRNVLIKSESATGTRSYVLFTDHADVDVRYAGFQSGGRTTLDPLDNTTFDANGAVTHLGTNEDDRNPVTFAHLFGPAGGQADGYQYTFVGNAVFCGLPTHRFKWGLTINDSHYGLIQGNFLYNWTGAGLATESGNESYNVIDGNIVIRGRGEGGRDGSGQPGNEGSAFWFRGPNNYVRNNIGANYVGNSIEASYGFKYYFVYLGNVRVPNFPGADTSVDGQYTVKDGNGMPLLEFSGNETYGMENGVTFWWVNTFGAGNPRDGGGSVLKDFRVWNQYLYGLYAYESNQMTIDGFTDRGKGAIGMFFSDYYSNNFVITHADIQGMGTGIIPTTNTGGTPFTIRDSYLRNQTDISVLSLWTSSYRSDWIPARTIIIRNVKFDPLPGQPHTAIAMSYQGTRDVENLILADHVFVYDYDQISGNNFEVYYREQAASFVLPQSTLNSDGSPRRNASPEAGLTNQQNWDKYGIALAGAIAPADVTTVADIDGLVHSI